MKLLLARLSALLLLAAGPAVAGDNLIGGDAAAGAEKALPCAACHGTDGNSINPEWPKIAGQHADYTFEQLKAFKLPQNDSPRFNALMFGQTQGLSEDDMRDLAAFFASQQVKPGAADPELVARGERIYRGGLPESNVPACIACHGPAGKGNAAAGYPALAGQHAVYTVNQLRAYAAGERQTDQNQIMRNIASQMSEEDMRAVASLIEGLQ
ncbi:MAG TPA: c-type cytochrome [Gammaproteobacteria bacterium]|nr:c-type cytochrome [Gammaproteobacteria bacterium]